MEKKKNKQMSLLLDSRASFSMCHIFSFLVIFFLLSLKVLIEFSTKTGNKSIRHLKHVLYFSVLYIRAQRDIFLYFENNNLIDF